MYRFFKKVLGWKRRIGMDLYLPHPQFNTKKKLILRILLGSKDLGTLIGSDATYETYASISAISRSLFYIIFS